MIMPNQVFFYGSQGDKFYIIIEGQVKIIVPVFEITPADPLTGGPEIRTIKDHIEVLYSIHNISCIKDAINKLKRLNTGDSFGEKALINNAPRQASIQCSTGYKLILINWQKFNFIITDCIFAVLNKSQF